MSFKLAAIFSDNMVFQHGIKVPVWGWAQPGDKITVAFGSQKKFAVAGKDGKWSVVLNKLKISQVPATMTVSSKIENRHSAIGNILVGDVWVCSGQSNMEWTVTNTKNAPQETAAANYPNIRLFHVPHVAKVKPDRDISASWFVCTPDNIGGFSAVGYFFGREIHRKTGIPLGLIDTAWGGTCAETWTSPEALKADPFFSKVVKDYEYAIRNPDEAQKEIKSKQKEWADKYDIKDTVNAGEEKGWQNPDTDTSKWKEMELPRNWQSAGYLHSGIFWFRKVVDVPADWEGKELTLSLGALDKSDVTYFNGVRVGSITMQQRPDAWCTPRIYTVPGNLVKAGHNLIAVRVFSNIYHGGFIGTPAQMRLYPSKEKNAEPIQLPGIWKYELEANFGLIPPQPPPPLGEGNPNSPHILYDNMIKPLLPFGIKGAIWYQGESNADRAKQYRKLFPLMIKSWRKSWAQGPFPFYFVQLANYQPYKHLPGESTWAELREAQTMTLSLPKTGMAVIIDIGEANDIHPKNKQDVGLRLALVALAKDYGYKNLVYSGPIYKSMKLENGKIRIKFDHIGGGLVAHGKHLESFEIAGKDRKFVWANAVIEGETVVVSSPKVSKPVAVRYGWSENPNCNLYNSSDLPASPFRTDNWPGITK